jgi:guanine deaminase
MNRRAGDGPLTEEDEVDAHEAELVRSAVELAAENAATGQLPFGAIVVRDGQVIGRGVNTTLAACDPTRHAEVEAVRDACRRSGELTLPGAIVYSSCEPCPMCQAVCVLSGVERVVYAASSDDATRSGFTMTTRLADLHRAMVDHHGASSLTRCTVDGDTAPFAAFQPHA